jgi:2-polyprenyl-3-methyl-5-hydroxy-6-metoxy-1,4-benzoquinol methylase
VHFEIQNPFTQKNVNTSASKDHEGLNTLGVIAKADHFNRWMFDQFKDQLKGEILEIGSGIGNISQLVIEKGHLITLSDYNEGYSDDLKRKFSLHKNVREIIRLDLVHWDFENKYFNYKEKFDTIFLLNVIEHIKDDLLAVKNCRYLLKEKGLLILLAPAYSWLYSSFDQQLGHYRRYSLKSLKESLKKNQFEILSGSHFNFTGIVGWLLFGKLLNKKMLGSTEMSAFNKIVPFAKIIDKLLLKKAGLSVIVKGIKK